MATATLPLRLLASKTLALPSAPSLPARCSLCVVASVPRRWRLLASAEEPAPAPVEAEVLEEVVVEEEEEEEEEAVPEPVEAQIAAAGAGKDADIFAVVMIGSRQYIVMPGRYIYTQRLKGANVNDQVWCLCFIRFRRILVHAVVEEQGRDDKVIVFKFKKKKKYQRKHGHRQPNTRLKITGVSGYKYYPADPILEPVLA